MLLQIKDVTKLDTDATQGEYYSDVVPRVGEAITYMDSQAKTHYRVVEVWYFGREQTTTDGAYLFCEPLTESPWEAMKRKHAAE